jgi:hypothetical protein
VLWRWLRFLHVVDGRVAYGHLLGHEASLMGGKETLAALWWLVGLNLPALSLELVLECS